MRFLINAGVFCMLLLLASCSNTLEPVDIDLTYNFTVNQDSNIRITIENSYNTVLDTIEDRIFSPGVYSVTWQSPEPVPEGIYYLKLYRDDRLSDTRQILITGGN